MFWMEAGRPDQIPRSALGNPLPVVPAPLPGTTSASHRRFPLVICHWEPAPKDFLLGLWP